MIEATGSANPLKSAQVRVYRTCADAGVVASIIE